MQIKQARNRMKISMHMITMGTQSTPALNTGIETKYFVSYYGYNSYHFRCLER